MHCYLFINTFSNCLTFIYIAYSCSFSLFIHLPSILSTDQIILEYLGCSSNSLIQPLSTTWSGGCAGLSVGNYAVVLPL